MTAPATAIRSPASQQQVQALGSGQEQNPEGMSQVTPTDGQQQTLPSGPGTQGVSQQQVQPIGDQQQSDAGQSQSDGLSVQEQANGHGNTTACTLGVTSALGQLCVLNAQQQQGDGTTASQQACLVGAIGQQTCIIDGLQQTSTPDVKTQQSCLVGEVGQLGPGVGGGCLIAGEAQSVTAAHASETSCSGVGLSDPAGQQLCLVGGQRQSDDATTQTDDEQACGVLSGAGEGSEGCLAAGSAQAAGPTAASSSDCLAGDSVSSASTGSADCVLGGQAEVYNQHGAAEQTACVAGQHGVSGNGCLTGGSPAPVVQPLRQLAQPVGALGALLPPLSLGSGKQPQAIAITSADATGQQDAANTGPAIAAVNQAPSDSLTPAAPAQSADQPGIASSSPVQAPSLPRAAAGRFLSFGGPAPAITRAPQIPALRSLPGFRGARTAASRFAASGRASAAAGTTQSDLSAARSAPEKASSASAPNLNSVTSAPEHAGAPKGVTAIVTQKSHVATPSPSMPARPAQPSAPTPGTGGAAAAGGGAASSGPGAPGIATWPPVAEPDNFVRYLRQPRQPAKLPVVRRPLERPG